MIIKAKLGLTTFVVRIKFVAKNTEKCIISVKRMLSQAHHKDTTQLFIYTGTLTEFIKYQIVNR